MIIIVITRISLYYKKKLNNTLNVSMNKLMKVTKSLFFVAAALVLILYIYERGTNFAHPRNNLTLMFLQLSDPSWTRLSLSLRADETSTLIQAFISNILIVVSCDISFIIK